MSELLPGRQAARLSDGLLDYLTTTFALAETEARSALRDFLADPDHGMLKGPYVRTGLPFSPAPRREVPPLDWMPEGFVPYAHQVAAFRRLSSRDGRPQPTLVTTGTGSGKTEAFLLPILDHCLRARRHGIGGVKALILYPMNALANDQAQRLARLITHCDSAGRQPLSALTAALYTGESGPSRTTVGIDGLITDREVIRKDPPDILLTNYKMLDHLLLRAEDQYLWQVSAESLTYLVLDEFHTYDGAQGTDVAMLLRRLGLALKSYWPTRDSTTDTHTAEDWKRTLGKVTPVGTSATLGPKGQRANTVVDFATTVFGERFTDSCVVAEERLNAAAWVCPVLDAQPRTITENVAQALATQLDRIDPTPQELTDLVVSALYEQPAGKDQKALIRGHQLVRELLDNTAQAVHITNLAECLIPGGPDSLDARRQVVLALLGALGHLRATGHDGLPERSMPSTEVHLWVREVSRIDRYAETVARFRWSDDGPAVSDDATQDTQIAFPAVYCRECGRSGWGVELAPIGNSLTPHDSDIRRHHADKEGRFRALLHAPAEAVQSPGITWFDPRARTLLGSAPATDEIRLGHLLPVHTHTGPDADDLSKRDECPSCGHSDAIRFVGSAVATLMSVGLSTMFGDPMLADGEKKALVFTDSVQDAAHRAGFVTARSHTLTLRSVLAAADQPRSLPDLVNQVMRQAGTDPVACYRLLPQELAAREDMRGFWRPDVRRTASASKRARTRLLFDACLEFGLVSGFGRTLERTGTMNAEVDAGAPDELAETCRQALASLDQTVFTEDLDDMTLLLWARGVLERMRTRGGIQHEWLKSYRAEDGNRWKIWGGRPKGVGMPAFPKGRTAPAFPRIGGKANPDGLLDPVTATQSWYTEWTKRCLTLTGPAAGMAVKALFEALTARGWLTVVATRHGATSYAIPAERVIVKPSQDHHLTQSQHLLGCSHCRSEFPVSLTTGQQLAMGPCLHTACRGMLQLQPMDPDNYYRRLYRSTRVRQVIAREHTSLLDATQRLAYEDGFKTAGDDPSAPNVLVATPTLEMGIDIGDLSSVFLASLPRSVANYVQRTGRAGRLTGNALDVAFVQGRGENLPRLGDPLSLINAPVAAPATYLSAEEILRRQYLAHLADQVARDPKGYHPRRVRDALANPEPGRTFLGDMLKRALLEPHAVVDRFLAAFAIDGHKDALVRSEAADALRRWATPDEHGRCGLVRTVNHALTMWEDARRQLRSRLDQIAERLPELESHSLDSDDERRAWREALAEQRAIRSQLAAEDNDYWIAVLERLGLLPNYTLVDDSVELNVTVSWLDAESGEYQTEPADFHRASANALRDFAPGATFYAGGLRIGIDAVDLGHDGSAIVTMQLCPVCGFVQEGAKPVPRCPRCQNEGIADTGQRVESVELTKVSAYVRQDESRISDDAEDRVKSSFVIAPAADIDPAKITQRWFTDTGLGVTYLRGLQLRWFNLGPRRHTSAPLMIAGFEARAPRFRVCVGCGHLDQVGLANAGDEHRPWCRLRTARQGDTRLVVLHRRLTTEGLLLTLPQSVQHDVFALPSLFAALQLGVRQVYGGAPNHLSVMEAPDPAQPLRTALLLHDGVPGGTGYLAELTDHSKLRQVLQGALDVVASCSCAVEGQVSCHKCLLPLSSPEHVEFTSRSTAERYLRDLLGIAADQPSSASSWRLTEDEPAAQEEPESALEQQFRAAFLALAKQLGASIRQTPGRWGNTIFVTLNSRTFRLQPQVQRGGTRLDFLLTSEMLPDIAIFTDGWRYHAYPQHNRIANDAEKRRTLARDGVLVLAVTSQDLKPGSKRRPAWYDETLARKLNEREELQHSAAAREALTMGPMAFLAAWLQDPDPANLGRFGATVAVMIRKHGAVPTNDALAMAAVARLPHTETTWVWRHGSLAVASAKAEPGRMPLAGVLDDETDLLSDEARESWQEWLRLANATMFVDPELRDIAAISEPVSERSGQVVIHGAWEQIAEEFKGDERALAVIAALSAHGVAPPDGELGMELGDDGIPYDFVWVGHRFAVTLDEPTPVADWHVFGPDPDVIAAAWKELAHG